MVCPRTILISSFVDSRFDSREVLSLNQQSRLSMVPKAILPSGRTITGMPGHLQDELPVPPLMNQTSFWRWRIGNPQRTNGLEAKPTF
jgi:hypothetical protein